ncbi:MAG: alpha/beta fold hydrolase [Desulfomonile tiedjei]|nr:alpha/beta fold hydrolase [Desulfomonile tiedjei]
MERPVPEIHTETLSVTAADGATSCVTVFAGSSEATPPVLICIPAMGVTAQYYEPLALACVAQGFQVVTADLRGNGCSSVRASRSSRFGYHEIVHYEMPAIVARVRGRFPANPLYLLGHSLGGQLGTLYASANPGEVDGLILVAACSVFYRGWDFPSNVGVLFGTQLARWIAGILGYFPGNIIGFGGSESKGVIRDWSREALTGVYNVAGSPHDFETLLRQLSIPVLAISLEDDWFAPKRAVRNLCKKMERAPLTYCHLLPGDVAAGRIGHFQWVRNAGPVIEEIREWLSKNEHCT